MKVGDIAVGMRKLLYCQDCPGVVYFYVFRRWKDEWALEDVSKNGSYGYKKDFDYKFEKGECILKDADFKEFNAYRQPGHTSYDNTMMYWSLQGKAVRDYVGSLKRVFVVSDNDEFIDGFMNGTMRPHEMDSMENLEELAKR